MEKYKTVIITGDFNLPQIDWIKQSVEGYNPTAVRFLKMCSLHDLHQVVTSPTRGGSTLDLVLTSKIDNITNTQILPPIGSSDHEAIEFSILGAPKTKRLNKEFPLLTEKDYLALANHLRNINWKVSFVNSRSVDDYWLTFKDIALAAVRSVLTEERAPMSRKEGKMYLPKVIKKARIRKRNAWKKWKQAPSVNNKKLYNVMSKVYSKQIKSYKEIREVSLMFKSQKSFY